MDATAEGPRAFVDAFGRHADALGLIEVAALFGDLFDSEPDEWTRWSIAQTMPDQAPTLGGTRFSTPYDEDY